MPSLFSAPAVDAVFNRIYLLKADSRPNWGTMNVATMLQHCRIIVEAMMRQKPSTQVPSLRQRISRMLILNGITKIPHGRRMPKQIADLMSRAGVGEFDAERQALMDSLSRFAAFTGTLSGAHPNFGTMSHKDWGRFAWVHLDHHLRQFGV